MTLTCSQSLVKVRMTAICLLSCHIIRNVTTHHRTCRPQTRAAIPQTAEVISKGGRRRKRIDGVRACIDHVVRGYSSTPSLVVACFATALSRPEQQRKRSAHLIIKKKKRVCTRLIVFFFLRKGNEERRGFFFGSCRSCIIMSFTDHEHRLYEYRQRTQKKSY